MFKWEHTYTDYNGYNRTETFYFFLKANVLLDLEWRTPGGLEGYVKNIMSKMDGQGLADTFKMLIEKSYGVKSPDGREFIQGDDVFRSFSQTEAFADLYIGLATDDKFAAEFINGIFPRESIEKLKQQHEMAEKAGISLVPQPPIQNIAGAPQAPVIPLVEGQVSGIPQATPQQPTPPIMPVI